MTPNEMVAEFHQAFGVHEPAEPQLPDDKTRSLRISLLWEEQFELCAALRHGDLVETADALGDILYVTYGAARVFGIDLDPVVAEIHRSNMTKLGEDGKPIRREDGKIIKPAGWQKPSIAAVLAAQAGEATTATAAAPAKVSDADERLNARATLWPWWRNPDRRDWVESVTVTHGARPSSTTIGRRCGGEFGYADEVTLTEYMHKAFWMWMEDGGFPEPKPAAEPELWAFKA